MHTHSRTYLGILLTVLRCFEQVTDRLPKNSALSHEGARRTGPGWGVEEEGPAGSLISISDSMDNILVAVYVYKLRTLRGVR